MKLYTVEYQEKNLVCLEASDGKLAVLPYETMNHLLTDAPAPDPADEPTPEPADPTDAPTEKPAEKTRPDTSANEEI